MSDPIFRGGIISPAVNQEGLVRKVKKIRISATPSGAEQDTGWDLPAKAIVHDVFIDVTTAEATAASTLIDVGLLSSETGGDTNGFLAAVDVSATGIVRGVATVTAGGSETYFASTTRGALLATFLAGADSAGDVGTNYEFPHLSSSVTAKSVVYDADGADWAEFRGDIYIVYDVIE